LISQTHNPLFYQGNIGDGGKALTKEVTDSINSDRCSLWLYNKDKTSIVCEQLYIKSENKWYNGIELFEKDFKGFSTPLLNTLFQSFSASVIMGFVAYLGLNIFDNVFNLNTLPGIFLQGLCAGILGIISCIFVLKCMKSVELEETIKTLHKKFWKVRPIAPDTREL
jgi:hypothetical protein